MPEALAAAPTMMSGFMGAPATHFETFSDLVDVFERRREIVASEGDISHDLRVLQFETAMRASKWDHAIVFRRDDDGLICDGVHRGIAYLRCIDAGVRPSSLPELLLAPLGSYRWPDGMKARVEAGQE